MARKSGLDYREFEKMLDGFKQLQKDHEVFIRNFLTEMGMRVLAQTIQLTPVVTGNLKARWELSSVFRQGDELYIVIFNSSEYASFVEDGHMQHKRWVPGKWEGDVFVYEKGAKTGMMLAEKWVEGVHMARVSISKVQSEIPRRYEKALTSWLNERGLV